MRTGLLLFATTFALQAANHPPAVQFHTSDRCIACHNGLTTPSGEDVSIGYNWRASIMANSARDPYWQASVRRETIDHPEVTEKVQDDCSICHMPIPRFLEKLKGQSGTVFSHLPFNLEKVSGQQAADGVTCSVCHQIDGSNFGKPESYNGNFIIKPGLTKDDHPEYGPFDIEKGHQHVMQSSTGGFVPNDQTHIRKAELCATCHTLITKAYGPGGKVIGSLPEQMPYEEWLHSDYRQKQTCQECHMPEVKEPVPIAHVLGVPRYGLHRHVFVAANFFMADMLNRYRDDLQVGALPEELTSSSRDTVDYLRTNAARLTLQSVHVSSDTLTADVFVENLGGHKLPTAYPARRAWLHVKVTGKDGQTVFESGRIHPDGSIEGNDNDADPTRYEPHYAEISRPDQVEIYEAILKDGSDHVTTGLLSAVGYLKDNRLLPHGFDKATANSNVAAVGNALQDEQFSGQGSRVRYAVPLHGVGGPFHVAVELWYQPIGFRWAHNLVPYGEHAMEPRRFTGYYQAMQSSTAVVLAKAETDQ